MTKINTVGPKGDTFIVSCNFYDPMFDAVNVTVAGEAGDILESASAKVSSTSTGVLGILAEATDGTQGNVRVMVRGVATVDSQKLNYGTAVEADIDAMLDDQMIVVVNK